MILIADLTEYEKQLLNGDFGEEAKQLMEILLKIIEVNNVHEFVDVKHVMIGNTCMLSIAGETGINFLVKLAEAGIKFRVPTYTNVVSVDLDRWRDLGISEGYAGVQLKGVEAWKRLGAILNCSCMPFFSGATPSCGDHVAYADTATVIVGNSCFGARSNRESDLVCLAAAITGRVPKLGYHINEHRRGQYLVDVQACLSSESDFGVLGCHVGKIVRDKIPVFRSHYEQNLSMQNLIQLGASLASTGTVSLFHWENVTPEIKQNPKYYFDEKRLLGNIVFTSRELQHAYQQLNLSVDSQVDLVYIGCPHCNIEKLKHIAHLLCGKRVNNNVRLWVAAPSSVKLLASRSGDLQRIEMAGGMVISDTCAVVLPIKSFNFKSIATDSGKAQLYLSNFGFETAYGSTERCIEAAISGRWNT